MTKHKFRQLRVKAIMLLTAFLMLLSCLFFFSACNNANSNTNDPNFSYTEEDNGNIKNGSFSFQSLNYKLVDYPIASPTGWEKASADNSSYSSGVNSGIIDVEDGWKEVLANLYDSSVFLNYAKEKFNFTDNDVKQAIQQDKGNNNYNPSSTEIKEYILKNYFNHQENGFKSPSVRENAQDNFVYMLNNYSSSSIGGVGQKVKSTSEVMLEKDSFYKFSAWVKCSEDLTGRDTINETFGANIQITNKFSGSAQQSFKISHIKNTEWTEYVVYVKSDANYDCAVSVILGLGYGDGHSSAGSYYTQGSAYFDDISFEKVEASAVPSSIVPINMSYNSKDADATEINTVINSAKTFVYNMEIENTINSTFKGNGDKYVTNLNTNSFNTTLTTSNIDNETAESILGTTSTYEATTSVDGEYLVKLLKPTAVTINVENNEFSLDNGEYAFVSFEVKAKLSAFGSNELVVDLLDTYGSVTEKRAAKATLTTDGEWHIVTLLIKNNFDGASYTTRTFSLGIVAGPAKFQQGNLASEFAKGEINIKNLTIAKGNFKEDTDTENVSPVKNLCSLYNTSTKTTISLYAGFSENFSSTETTPPAYNLKTAPGDIGTIISKPADVANYDGVVSNHIYVQNVQDGVTLESNVNTRAGTGDANGNVAGLINTKYLTAYEAIPSLANIRTALGNYGEEDIQPLMIYNNDGTSYGFLGKENIVAANANASVSVKLKVADLSATDKATAYIYLVGVSGLDKEILALSNFTVNTDIVESIEKGTEIDGDNYKLMLKVDSALCNNEFITVNFYIGSGATEKNFRVEVWNGQRDGEGSSKGYVFVDSVTVTTAGAFTEAASWTETFNSTSNPLGAQTKSAFIGADGSLLAYRRELTEVEEKFNKEYPDKKVDYKVNYVWAQNSKTIYAVFNAIDPLATDPYASIEPEENTAGAGCTANSDPSSFWLGFSSILLGAVLILAIVALFVRNIRNKRKANKSDAKSHYVVKSRISAKKTAEKKVSKKIENIEVDEEDDQPYTATVDSVEEDNAEQTTEEENVDSYVYGDVQSFGEESVEDTNDSSEKE